MKPKALMIGVSGPSCSPRYYITDTKGIYWTGNDWAEDRRKAFLFHRLNEVGDTLHALMLIEVPGPLLTYTLSLVIDAKSETPLDLDALKAWLAKAAQVQINAEHGPGPIPNSMVMIRIDWEQLKETPWEDCAMSLEMRCLDAELPGGRQLAAVTTVEGHYKRDMYFYQTENGEFYVEIHVTVHGEPQPRERMWLYDKELRKIAEAMQKVPPKTATPGIDWEDLEEEGET